MFVWNEAFNLYFTQFVLFLHLPSSDSEPQTQRNVLFCRYLITAPKLLRLDASENVVVQLFGHDQEITVHLYLKNTLALGHIEYASQSLKLNAENNYQASATLRVGLKI